MEPIGMISRSAVKRLRAAAFIMALAMMFSCLLFYYEDDINYAVSGLAAPALKKLTYSQTKPGYKAVLTWQAKKGREYQVLRKTSSSGKYKVLASVKATSATGKYTDSTIGKNKTFTYTVRRVIMSGKKVKETGKYDSEGLTTIRMPSSLKVDFTNLKADLSWEKVSGINKYLVYRRVGKCDKFYKINTLASSKKKYTDWWYYSTKGADKSTAYGKKLAKIVLNNYYLDPSNNPVSYIVRGYYSKKVNLVKKESYGLYLPDGEFRLETPAISSISDDGKIIWGTVANADGYRLYSSNDGSTWTKITDVASTGSDYISSSEAPLSDIYQEYKLQDFDSDLYYTVRAFASKNGKRLYSSYDTGFTTRNRKYSEKILCVGDSISFGSPYRDNLRKNFTYQNRISQLTGVSFFNPSISGATYHHGVDSNKEFEEETDSSTSKIVTGIVQMVVKGQNTDNILINKAGTNKTHLYDYDVVVLAGGTNDYLHYNSSIRSAADLIGNNEIDWEKITDSEKTRNLKFTVNYGTNIAETYNESYDYNITTFDGAYNQILKWIEEASIYRVQHGQKPIQVVSMSMFYSDRVKSSMSPYYIPANRDVTKNSLGLTLKDYQNELDYLNDAWKDTAAFKLYQYDTRAAGILDGSTCAVATADNLHLTKNSYARYGNSISDFMISKFLGEDDKKEDGIKADSARFLARAAKYGLLSERLNFLESKAASGAMLQSTSAEEVEMIPDQTVEEMAAYIRLLYEYGYLDQMLDECSPEDRVRYETFIEFYNILGEEPEQAAEADNNDDDEASVYEEEQDEEADTDAADSGYYDNAGTDIIDDAYDSSAYIPEEDEEEDGTGNSNEGNSDGTDTGAD